MTENLRVVLPDTKITVEIKPALGYWDFEAIRAAMQGAAQFDGDAVVKGQGLGTLSFNPDIMLNAKRVLFQRAIVSIKREDGTDVPVEGFLEDLTNADGEALFNTLDTLKKK